MRNMANRGPTDRSEPMTDDGNLLKRISHGDLDRFDEFVDRYKARLMSYICPRIRDVHRAEDLTQEVFLRAFRAARRGDYRGGSNAAGWLFTIARNCVTDYLRACGKEAVVPVDELEEKAPRCAGEEPCDASARSSETPAEIAAAGGIDGILAALPEPQREVLTLKVLSGLTFAEIAEVMDCKLSTVKSRMHYALTKAREIVVRAGSESNGQE